MILSRTVHGVLASVVLAVLAASAVAAEENRLDNLIALVRQRGWPTDLARFCPPLGIELNDSQCLAQQVAFFANGRERALNLIPLKPGAVSYIVIIDIKGEAGTVYLATPRGELISMSKLSVGSDGEKESAEAAHAGFEGEISFWSANVGQFDKWLERRKYGPIPKLQPTN